MYQKPFLNDYNISFSLKSFAFFIKERYFFLSLEEILKKFPTTSLYFENKFNNFRLTGKCLLRLYWINRRLFLTKPTFIKLTNS